MASPPLEIFHSPLANHFSPVGNLNRSDLERRSHKALIIVAFSWTCFRRIST